MCSLMIESNFSNNSTSFKKLRLYVNNVAHVTLKNLTLNDNSDTYVKWTYIYSLICFRGPPFINTSILCESLIISGHFTKSDSIMKLLGSKVGEGQWVLISVSSLTL